MDVKVADTVHFHDGLRCCPATVLDDGTAGASVFRALAVMMDSPFIETTTEKQMILVRKENVPYNGAGSAHSWHRREDCTK